MRPIAGTRKRGASPEEDAALAAELLADEKERAEHTQLLDLGRNDCGRVARIGSVKLTENMIVERYSHVMHIVSNVEGKLQPGLDALDVLRATFPAGTVSGARRCGPWKSSTSWNRSSAASMPVPSATQLQRRHGRRHRHPHRRHQGQKLHVQAGAGIVADSESRIGMAGNPEQGPGRAACRRAGRTRSRHPLQLSGAGMFAQKAAHRSGFSGLAGRFSRLVPGLVGRQFRRLAGRVGTHGARFEIDAGQQFGQHAGGDEMHAGDQRADADDEQRPAANRLAQPELDPGQPGQHQAGNGGQRQADAAEEMARAGAKRMKK